MPLTSTKNLKKYASDLDLLADKPGNLVQLIDELQSLDAQTVTPDDAEGVGVNVIDPTSRSVAVGANVNNTDDFIVLPALASVAVGHTITVVSNAAGHEVRTPAGSNEKINNQDADGTKEYAIASGSQIHHYTKISNSVGWMGQGFTALGTVVTAVIPD